MALFFRVIVFVNHIFYSFSVVESEMTQVFFVFYPLYALLSGFVCTTYIFPFKELFIHLFKHGGYMFCFPFGSSYVSIWVYKNFIMILGAINECYNRTILIYT